MLQPQATEPLEKVDKFFETFYSYIVRDALDVSLAFSAHGRVEDHPNVPGLSQVGHETAVLSMKCGSVRKVLRTAQSTAQCTRNFDTHGNLPFTR
jgi:hypothetical protein